MKLVGYLRVSTDMQAEHGLGLDVQEAGIRQWAKANGHRIVAWCRDEGESGSNGLDTRDGLATALAALSDGTARGLVVYRLDRLARDLMVQERLLADIWHMGREVYSTVGSEADLRDDPDDPGRTFVRQMLGAMAQYERAMIVLRMRAGKRLKLQRGGYGGGWLPLGYQAQDGDFTPDPDEQRTLDRIRQLHGEGRSLRQITQVLTQEGHRTKRGGTWQPSTVARILQREDQHA